MKQRIRAKYPIIILLGFILASFNANAQAFGAAVPFLVISPDARGSGMGEVGTAIADDVAAVFWNPAGFGFKDSVLVNSNTEEYQPYRQVMISASRWLPQFNADLFYVNGAFAHYFPSLDGTLAINVTFMNLGQFTKTDENGTARGTFLSNEIAFGLCYGTIIAKDLALGMQLKFIRSNLSPTQSSQTGGSGVGYSGGFDLGTLWKPKELKVFDLDLEDNLAIGANLQNVGPKLTYIAESDPLPTELRLGIAYDVYEDPDNTLKLAFDYAKLLVRRDSLDSDPLPKSLYTGWGRPGASLCFGAEWWYRQVFALRAGYFHEPSPSSNRQYLNFGAGLRVAPLNVDFSFISPMEENHPLANTMRITLKFDLN